MIQTFGLGAPVYYRDPVSTILAPVQDSFVCFYLVQYGLKVQRLGQFSLTATQLQCTPIVGYSWSIFITYSYYVLFIYF